MAGIPSPGAAGLKEVEVTPPAPKPQERHTTPANIRRFFDPATYQLQEGVSQTPRTEAVRDPQARHTTPENIRRFFDPTTYRTDEPRGRAQAKDNSLTLGDLVEKFRLAAQLNGHTWSEVAVAW